MVCQPTYYEPHKRETLKICTSNEKKKKEKANGKGSPFCKV